MQVQNNTFVYLRHYFKNRGVSLGGTSFIILKSIDNKGIIWNIRELLTWIKGNKKGFTLVEIIVVLVILAILAAIAVPSVLGYVEQAKESEQLYKVRDALIASQTTLIRTYGTDGEFGDDNGSKNGNKN